MGGLLIFSIYIFNILKFRGQDVLYTFYDSYRCVCVCKRLEMAQNVKDILSCMHMDAHCNFVFRSMT